MFDAIRRARRAGIPQKYEPQVAIIIALTLLVAAANAVEPLVLKRDKPHDQDVVIFSTAASIARSSFSAAS